MKAIVISLLCAGALLLSGCMPSIKSEAELYSWLANPENGLVKNRNVAGVALSARYLPPAYLAFRELKSASPQERIAQGDSVLNTYRGSYTFLLRLGPDDAAGEQFNIQELGVENLEEYRDQTYTLNFDLAPDFSLRTGKGALQPVSASMENIYGLSNSRTIYLVFSPATQQEAQILAEASELDLVYTDRLFDTGIHHFTFESEAVYNIPSFEFRNLSAS